MKPFLSRFKMSLLLQQQQNEELFISILHFLTVDLRQFKNYEVTQSEKQVTS